MTSSGSKFQVGDKVCIGLSAERLKDKQTENGGWFSGMIACVGKTGEVKQVSNGGLVTVEFRGLRYTFNPSVLTRVPTLAVGDIVRIDADKSKVALLQENHGGWNSDMEQALGKVGKVIKVDNDGDALVSFGQRTWMFNPACCQPAPGCTPDSISAVPRGASRGRQGLGGAADGEGVSEQLLGLLGGLLLLEELRDALPGGHLFKAVAHGDLATVKSLLAKDKDLVKTKHQGMEPLFVASNKGHLDIAKALLEAGADLEAKDRMGNTALGAAIVGKEVEVAQWLLGQGARTQVTLENRGTLLHLAAISGAKELVPLLLQRGCSPNAQDGSGDTPLHDALSQDNTGAAEALLAAPSLDLTLRNARGFTPLQWACLKGNPAVTELIAKKQKAVVDLQKDDGYAAIHLAAINDHSECIEKLLQHGDARLELTESQGRTALHVACSKAYEDPAKVLIKHGANVNAVSTKGHTPLHFVMNAGNPQGGSLLAMMLLHTAVKDEVKIRLACFLLEKGAIFDALDSEGNVPLDYCHSSSVKSDVEAFVRNSPPGMIKRRQGPSLGGAAGFFRQSQNFGFRPGSGSGSRPASGRPGALSLCKLCREALASIMLDPCQHKVLCRDCCLKVEKCPQCDTTIQRRIQSSGEALECSIQ